MTNTPHRLARRARTDEDSGTALLFIVVALVALFGMAGLAIDGGQAYAERRQMQNASDAAALAGANAFNAYLREPTPARAIAINEAVSSTAVQNGVDASSVTCMWVDEAGNETQPCTVTDEATMDAAAGVRVNTTNTKDTFFVKVVGVDDFQASASSEAQVMALRSLPIRAAAPFLACATHPTESGANVPLIVADATADTGYSLNPSAVGQVYPIHGPSSYFDSGACGGGSSSFNGVAGDGGDVPGVWDPETGTVTGQIDQGITGVPECPSVRYTPAEGCVLLLPICPQGNGTGSGFRMFCTNWGLFMVRTIGSSGNRHSAELLGGAPIISDGVAGGRPEAGETRVIRLTD